MEVRPHRTIERKKTKLVKVGNVSVGNNSIITVQSMTNTITSDILGTVKQINDLEDAGADIVRVSCPDEQSTAALKQIVKEYWEYCKPLIIGELFVFGYIFHCGTTTINVLVHKYIVS